MMTNLTKSASPSEPRTHNFLARIELAQVLGGLLQSQENLLDDLHKYFAAEPRRDEREEQRQFDAIKEVLEEAHAFVQKSEGEGSAELYAYLEGAQDNLYELRQAWASRASAALPQTPLLEFISDYVATWKDAHPVKECARPSVCLVCRGRKLLGEAEYQRIHSAVPQPSASAAPLSQNVRKLWIVEWKFTGVGGDWKSIHSEPFETEAAALTYPKRQGFEYRVVEYSASQPQPSAGQTEGKSNG